MINEPSTGYWDYSSANDQAGPQWVDYGSPGARPNPGSINVGGTTPPSTIGSGGMPVGGANPILSTTPSQQGLAPPTQQFTPQPFMPPGMTFQPRTQFGQQASAPLNLGQQGQMYGQMPGGPNMAQPPQQQPHPQQLRNIPSQNMMGGSSGFMPQFQNPFGPQAQPQQYSPMGQQPTQISQQPQQPDAAGIALLLRNAMQNRFGNAT